MFYHLNGTVSDLNPDSAVIECGGVGYLVTVAPGTVSSLKIGEQAKLYVAESIAEDHYDLYGFLTLREKDFYTMLTGVSGIGPKASMSILSFLTPDAIVLAIANGNESAFTSCPGIGKKTAQRIILELKDKVAKQLDSVASSTPGASIPAAGGGAANNYEEALTALGVLGYNHADVSSVIRQIDISGMTTEEIIKAVLKFMV